jgi:hypothetical protein
MGASLGIEEESAIFEHGRQKLLNSPKPLAMPDLASAREGAEQDLPLVWVQLRVMKAQDEATKRMENLQTRTFIGFCVSAAASIVLAIVSVGESSAPAPARSPGGRSANAGAPANGRTQASAI